MKGRPNDKSQFGDYRIKKKDQLAFWGSGGVSELQSEGWSQTFRNNKLIATRHMNWDNIWKNMEAAMGLSNLD